MEKKQNGSMERARTLRWPGEPLLSPPLPPTLPTTASVGNYGGCRIARGIPRRRLAIDDVPSNDLLCRKLGFMGRACSGPWTGASLQLDPSPPVEAETASSAKATSSDFSFISKTLEADIVESLANGTSKETRPGHEK